jgi:hypothetical protein
MEHLNNKKSISILDEKVFRKRLKRVRPFDENKLSSLSYILQETGAVIAGGGVLGAYTDFYSGDLDFYVSLDQCSKLINFIINSGYRNIEFNLAPSYDQSFFRKNGIMGRLFFIMNRRFRTKRRNEFLTDRNHDEDNIQHRTIRSDIDIDIMIVPTRRDVLKAVTNFDLSFCETWYDGKNVYTADFNGVTTKKGILQPNYTEALIKYSNFFIIKRMNKYTERGFEITYSLPSVRNITHLRATKTISDPEHWVIRSIYKIWLQNLSRYKNSVTKKFLPTGIGFSKYPLLNYNLSSLLKLVNEVPNMLTRDENSYSSGNILRDSFSMFILKLYKRSIYARYVQLVIGIEMDTFQRYEELSTMSSEVVFNTSSKMNLIDDLQGELAKYLSVYELLYMANQSRKFNSIDVDLFRFYTSPRLLKNRLRSYVNANYLENLFDDDLLYIIKLVIANYERILLPEIYKNKTEKKFEQKLKMNLK